MTRFTASAVTAAAHKLARLIYATLTGGQDYTDRRQDYFEERYCQRAVNSITLAYLHGLAERMEPGASAHLIKTSPSALDEKTAQRKTRWFSSTRG